MYVNISCLEKYLKYIKKTLTVAIQNTSESNPVGPFLFRNNTVLSFINQYIKINVAKFSTACQWENVYVTKTKNNILQLFYNFFSFKTSDDENKSVYVLLGLCVSDVLQLYRYMYINIYELIDISTKLKSGRLVELIRAQ